MFTSVVPLGDVLATLEELTVTAPHPDVGIAAIQSAIAAARASGDASDVARLLEVIYRDVTAVRWICAGPTTHGALAVLRAHAGVSWSGVPATLWSLHRLCSSMPAAWVNAGNVGPAPFCVGFDETHVFVADHLLYEAQFDLEWSWAGGWVGSADDPQACFMQPVENRFVTWVRILHQTIAGDPQPPTVWLTSPRFFLAITARAWPIAALKGIPGGVAFLESARRMHAFLAPAVHHTRPPLWWLDTHALPELELRGLAMRSGDASAKGLNLAAFRNRPIDDAQVLSLVLAMAAPGQGPHVQLARLLSRTADRAFPNIEIGMELYQPALRRTEYSRPLPPGPARIFRYVDECVVCNDLAVGWLLEHLKLIPDCLYIGTWTTPMLPRHLYRGGLLDVLARMAIPCRPTDAADGVWWSWGELGPQLAPGFVAIPWSQLADWADDAADMEPASEGFLADPTVVKLARSLSE